MSRVARIGRYEIVAPLAAGGMGHVFLARMRSIGGFERHVVLKTIDLSGDDREQMTAMFLDEARVLGRLHHQHIAPVFEVNEDDGKLYLVIDYIHGRTAEEIWQQALARHFRSISGSQSSPAPRRLRVGPPLRPHASRRSERVLRARPQAPRETAQAAIQERGVRERLINESLRCEAGSGTCPRRARRSRSPDRVRYWQV